MGKTAWGWMALGLVGIQGMALALPVRAGGIAPQPFTRPLPPQLAQGEAPNAPLELTIGSFVQGHLTPQNPTLRDGSYYSLYRFTGEAGTTVVVSLVSPDFNAALLLLGPEGNPLAGDGGVRADARIVLTLPTTGTYTIVANTLTAGEQGGYQLAVDTLAPTGAAPRDRPPATGAELSPTQRRQLTQAETRFRQAQDRYDVGDDQAAEQLFLEYLALVRQVLGDEDATVVVGLDHLALVYWEQSRYGEAALALEESLSIQRRILADTDPALIASLDNLALIYTVQGRYDEATPLYREALERVRQVWGEQDFQVAVSLNNLAENYERQGQEGAAIAYYQEALTLLRQLGQETDPEAVFSRTQLGLLYWNQGRYGEAESLLVEVVAIRRLTANETGPLAASLNNLALVYEAQGRYGLAEIHYQEALTLIQRLRGDTHPDVASGQSNLAGLYAAQGRYGEAEPLFQAALELWRRALGSEDPQDDANVATGLNNLAGLYLAQGRYGEAQQLFQEALALRQRLLAPGDPEIGLSLNNLALAHEAQGNYDAAEPLYQQALTLWQETLAADHPLVAMGLHNLAGLYHSQRNYGAAAAGYEAALALRQQRLGTDHPDVAASLSGLAAVARSQGRYSAAEALYREVLALQQRSLGADHPQVANTWANLTLVAMAQQQVEPAIASLATALDIEDFNLSLNLATLAEAQRQAYSRQMASGSAFALILHLEQAFDNPDAARLALTTILRRKGRMLDAAANSTQRLRQQLTPEDQTLLDQLMAVRQQLAAQLYAGPGRLPLQQYQANIARLKTEENQLESTLARRSAAFRVETQAVDIDAVLPYVPANGALVEFIRYRSYDFERNVPAAARYAAYVLLPGGELHWADLGEVEAINGAIDDLSAYLQDPSNTNATPARELAALVLDPIAPYVQGVDHVLIAPDGQLNRVPFEVLVTAQGQHFIETHLISYLGSGRDLLRLDNFPPSRQGPVLMGNPDYGELDVSVQALSPARAAAAGISALATQRFWPLPGSAVEVNSIAPLFPDATVFKGAAATEAALKQVQGPRILHVATHGFFLEDVAEVGAAAPLGLGGQGGAGTTAVEAQENPLLRSGLALAGFNQRRSGDEDGVLTALEASSLDLYGTQLVVLSACDTGLGDVANGEGIYGLRRAFAIAGAQAQILSLWQVNDVATAELMHQYYQALIRGQGRAAALRQVQLQFLRSDSYLQDPYYWGAFTLAGDWRSLD